MARSWVPGRAQSPRCRRWVEAASPPTKKPPSSEALQTTAFSGRPVPARESWGERDGHAIAPGTRAPAEGTGSGHRAGTHNAGAEPSTQQLLHQRRGQRCVGPEEL